MFKFFLCTEDYRKSNDTLSITAEMGEFASVLMGCHSPKVDWTGIFTRFFFLQGKEKKGRELIQEGISIRSSLSGCLYVAAGYCDLGSK